MSDRGASKATSRGHQPPSRPRRCAYFRSIAKVRSLSSLRGRATTTKSPSRSAFVGSPFTATPHSDASPGRRNRWNCRSLFFTMKLAEVSISPSSVSTLVNCARSATASRTAIWSWRVACSVHAWFVPAYRAACNTGREINARSASASSTGSIGRNGSPKGPGTSVNPGAAVIAIVPVSRSASGACAPAASTVPRFGSNVAS